VAAERIFLGLALTATAGWIDAVGFLRLNGFYVSFMSGNTTRLGIALFEEQWGVVTLALAIVALFFAGSFCGGLTAAVPDRLALPAILGFEAVLLVLALALSARGLEHQAVLVLPVAMGVQNGAVYRLHPGATTFVTGTLFRAGHELARRIVGVRDAAWLSQLCIWLSFAVGAAAGATANARWGMVALTIPLAIASICAISALALAQAAKEIEA
jgi:uncharacterized membrane protein YoaK (UPF0700 family)